MWGLTGFICFITGIPALMNYLDEGGFHIPKGHNYVTGPEAVFLLVALIGLGVISVLGVSYCTFKLKKSRTTN